MTDLIQIIIFVAQTIVIGFLDQSLHWVFDLIAGIAIGLVIMSPFLWKWSDGFETLRKR
jgi:hypothetical protein